jgi:hypothetical protein
MSAGRARNAVSICVAIDLPAFYVCQPIFSHPDKPLNRQSLIELLNLVPDAKMAGRTKRWRCASSINSMQELRGRAVSE